MGTPAPAAHPHPLAPLALCAVSLWRCISCFPAIFFMSCAIAAYRFNTFTCNTQLQPQSQLQQRPLAARSNFLAPATAPAPAAALCLSAGVCLHFYQQTSNKFYFNKQHF